MCAGRVEDARSRDSRAACASTQGKFGWLGVGTGHVDAERVERSRICWCKGFRGSFSCFRAIRGMFILDGYANECLESVQVNDMLEPV